MVKLKYKILAGLLIAGGSYLVLSRDDVDIIPDIAGIGDIVKMDPASVIPNRHDLFNYKPQKKVKIPRVLNYKIPTYKPIKVKIPKLKVKKTKLPKLF